MAAGCRVFIVSTQTLGFVVIHRLLVAKVGLVLEEALMFKLELAVEVMQVVE